MEGETANGTAPAASMPHLECVDRVKKIPFVEAAWNQSTEMYGKVKGSNGVINWTLSTAEATMQKAMEQAVPIAAPIAKKLETPINVMDKTLCKGLSLVEDKMPIVKEPPHQVFLYIYETAKTYILPTYNKVSAVKDFGSSKAHSLKELSWNKANEVLSTRYGNVAYNGFDTAAQMAEQYLNYFFPATEEELAEDEKETAELENDKVLHTVHTVGRLSNKLGRRVYRTLSGQVQNLNKQNVQEYITSLVAVMQLTNYLNTLYQKAAPSKQEASPQEKATVS